MGQEEIKSGWYRIKKFDTWKLAEYDADTGDWFIPGVFTRYGSADLEIDPHMVMTTSGDIVYPSAKSSRGDL